MSLSASVLPVLLFMIEQDLAEKRELTDLSFRPLQEQKAGDYVIFRAEQDCVVAFSACPWDLGEMNGIGGMPKDASFQIFKA